MNSKWIKGLKVKTKTTKLLAENIGINLQDLGFGHELLDTKPKHEQQKKKHKFDFIKIKNFQGAWVAQSVGRPTSAQIMIPRSVSLSPG